MLGLVHRDFVVRNLLYTDHVVIGDLESKHTSPNMPEIKRGDIFTAKGRIRRVHMDSSQQEPTKTVYDHPRRGIIQGHIRHVQIGPSIGPLCQLC